jgi:HK97 family phage major capsid protein
MTLATQVAEASRSYSLDSSANDFLKVAKVLAASRGDISEMRMLTENVKSPRVRDVLEKAAVGVATLGNASAIAAYRELAQGFFGSMKEFSAFSRIYDAGGFTRVPVRTLVAVLTSAPVGYPVSELAAKPLGSASFATATLELQKVHAIIVISNELAKSASASSTAMLGAELRRAASISLDSKFLALMAATSGITTAATTGTTASQVLADLSAALLRLTIGADSRLWWIVSPKLYKTLSLVQGIGGYLLVGGKIGDINVAPSDAATTGATLVDARQVAAELDELRLDTTTNAALQLDDNPTSGSYQTVSLFQNNMTGLRCVILFGAIATRSTSVTTITGYAA